MGQLQESALDIKVESNIFSQLDNYEHEEVVFGYDKASGLKCIIAIHNTVLGPSLGGTRIWNYNSEGEAVNDVLRLSRGMTYKSAISGINLGGGKAVIIGDASKIKTPELLRNYGKIVESLNGKYITAEDVGTSTADMEYIAETTSHVTGQDGGSGDPSPFTAYGTYLGIKAAAKEKYGHDDLNGKKIGVQGIGHVGNYLLEYLSKENAHLFVTDINKDRVGKACAKYNATAVASDDIYDIDMDIYAPCALGATLNDDTIARLKCQIVAGSANNQLKDEVKHGNMLLDKDILYVPDFLINAGGVINIYCELEGTYDKNIAKKRVEYIYDRSLEIFSKAKKDGISTHQAAMQMAQERINEAKKAK